MCHKCRITTIFFHFIFLLHNVKSCGQVRNQKARQEEIRSEKGKKQNIVKMQQSHKKRRNKKRKAEEKAAKSAEMAKSKRLRNYSQRNMSDTLL